ncbi:DnaJ protein ERDJ2A [Hondaea fermentalgiana]|uniref:DnaJ protein ERDJ2A n=1 Tax=Hondaea fermentalgiana TaxID=2315210 RepID=A0A2R5GPP2_9STRA|nr:DnaJ protein ERDJ2A [Hondaea fermentalgiana]|eukprot:GBG32846.1 DnaJ protein ERDJ2A [Hondaea fermentalgiana]
MPRLAYDDSAALYFGIMMIFSALVPLTFSFVRTTLHKLSGSASYSAFKPRSSLEKRKLEKIAQDHSARKIIDKSFLTRLALLAAGWLLLVFLVSQTGEQIQQFDPWEVLGLSQGSTKKQVKKAYHVMNLQYHPDRQLGKSADEKALAATMLEKVQNAYSILTDEEAYERYMSTGSPDGSKMMEVSVGLPSALLDKKYQNLVLVVYLLMLVVAIPVVVGRWYSNSKKFGDKLILNDSYNLFIHLLDNKVTLEQMPEILALSAEFRDLPARSAAEEQALDALRDRMVSEGRMERNSLPLVAKAKMLERWPGCARAKTLIHAHLNRLTDELSSGQRGDIDRILTQSRMLIDAMYDTVLVRRSFKGVRVVVEFEQRITQALWVLDSSLQQLPHFGRLEAKQASLGSSPIKTIKDFMAAPEQPALGPGRKKGMSSLSDSQVHDVAEVTRLLPDVNFKVTIGVISHENPDGTLEFEDQAQEGDIMTAYFELERLHVPHDEADFPVHAPFLPFTKPEKWSVIFHRPGDMQVMAHVFLQGSSRTLRGRTQFPSKGFLKPKQEYKFGFTLLCHAYVDFDEKVTQTVSIQPEGFVKPKEIHPEDLELDNEPTLFEEAFGKAVQSEDSDFADSDDEEDADETDAASESANAVRKRVTKAKAAKKSGADDLAVDDDDDDDFETIEADTKKSK